MGKFRAWSHIIIGIIYVALSFFIMYFKTFGTIELGNFTAYALGALLIVYGLFRIWRGRKDFQILKEMTEETQSNQP